MPNTQEIQIGKEIYKKHSAIRDTALDRHIAKEEYAGSYSRAVMGMSSRHRKRRDAAFLKLLPQAIERVPGHKKLNRGAVFSSLWTGGHLFLPLGVPQNLYAPLHRVAMCHVALFCGERSHEYSLLAMFIMDNICEQDSAQWDRLCDLYRDVICMPETQEKLPETSCPTELRCQKSAYYFPAVYSPIGYPAPLHAAITRTIEAVFPFTDTLFEYALKQRQVSDFVYDAAAAQTDEVKRWEAILSLILPKTVEICCERFKELAWGIWEDYWENVCAFSKRSQTKDIFNLSDTRAKPLVGPMAERVPANEIPGERVLKSCAPYTEFFNEWYGPVRRRFEPAPSPEQAPWLYVRRRINGVPVGPTLEQFKEHEAVCLLFAAFVMAYCGDDFLFADRMYIWALDGILRQLPGFPTKVLIFRQIGQDDDRDENEEIYDGVWRFPVRDNVADRMPVWPEDPVIADEAINSMTRTQYLYMHNRAVWPLSLTGHLSFEDDATEEITVPDAAVSAEEDVNRQRLMLRMWSMQERYNDYIRRTFAEYMKATSELKDNAALETAAPSEADGVQEELARLRAALKQTQELVRVKNEEIKELRSQIPSDDAENADPAEEMERKDSTALQDSSQEDEPENEDYTLQNKIVVLGGTARFMQELRDQLKGDVRFINTDEMRPDFSQCLNAVLFVQTSYVSHRLSNWAVAYCKQNKVPIQYFQSTGAANCIKQIIKYDKRITKNAREVRVGAGTGT